MTDQEALDIMQRATAREGFAQVSPNASAKLRFTTATCVSPNCKGDDHDESQYTIYQHEHHIIHDVVRVEVVRQVDDRVLVKAWTAEGDYCYGRAVSVLRRLTESSMTYTTVAPVAPAPIAPPNNRSWLRKIMEG